MPLAPHPKQNVNQQALRKNNRFAGKQVSRTVKSAGAASKGATSENFVKAKARAIATADSGTARKGVTAAQTAKLEPPTKHVYTANLRTRGFVGPAKEAPATNTANATGQKCLSSNAKTAATARNSPSTANGSPDKINEDVANSKIAVKSKNIGASVPPRANGITARNNVPRPKNAAGVSNIADSSKSKDRAGGRNDVARRAKSGATAAAATAAKKSYQGKNGRVDAWNGMPANEVSSTVGKPKLCLHVQRDDQRIVLRDTHRQSQQHSTSPGNSHYTFTVTLSSPNTGAPEIKEGVFGHLCL
jgi:hypothetical protein